MITLGGVAIDSNMYLEGVEKAKLTSSTQVRTQDGVSYLMIKPIYGGRQLTLGSVSQDGARQGFWCQLVVDQVKDLEQQALPITLDYNGDTYTVVITDTSSLAQFNQREPLSDTKAYTGQILLLEV